jgi:hypothetical protein
MSVNSFFIRLMGLAFTKAVKSNFFHETKLRA